MIAVVERSASWLRSRVWSHWQEAEAVAIKVARVFRGALPHVVFPFVAAASLQHFYFPCSQATQLSSCTE